MNTLNTYTMGIAGQIFVKLYGAFRPNQHQHRSHRSHIPNERTEQDHWQVEVLQDLSLVPEAKDWPVMQVK